MLVGLYSAATGMQAGERLHEVVSENLAHLGVPGYRANVVSFEVLENPNADAEGTTSPEGYGTIEEDLRTDFTPGAILNTGRTLDVAISGDGFFVLQGPQGPLYTRNGVFYVNPTGELTNGEGMPVIGDGGPISIPRDTTAGEVHIAPDGTVEVDGAQVGRIRIARFEDPDLLVRAGTSLFESGSATPEDVDPYLLQGSRELSNVSAINEMVRMIQGMRFYEAAQKALTTIDEAVSQNTDPQA